jgi:hypothetical protein
MQLEEHPEEDTPEMLHTQNARDTHLAKVHPQAWTSYLGATMRREHTLQD